jgi:SsrA-binding protein
MSGHSGPGEKLIASNPNARQNYEWIELVEAGLVLTGTEIKSIRAQSPNLRDAFVEVQSRGTRLEAFLVNAHVAPYSHGNIWNHEPGRRRKLLLHRHQIERIFGAITQKGLTCVPTRMYYKKGLAKVELAVARGKKQEDRREDIKKRSADREMEQALKKTRR